MNRGCITAVLLLCLGLGSTGCTSIRSTLLHRDECNMGWEARKLKGMPITLKVPTHVRLDVVQTKYLKRDDGGYSYLAVGTEVVQQFEVERTIIETEKIFTVDFKRPAAGTLNYTAKLSPTNQYFEQVTSNINDITIQEASKAFERILSALPKAALTGPPGNTGDGPASPQEVREEALVPIRTVVASEIFDIEDPMFEDNIRGFLHLHVTQPQQKNVAELTPDFPSQQYAQEPFSPGTPVQFPEVPPPVLVPPVESDSTSSVRTSIQSNGAMKAYR